ncbi:PREDICTED: uncharacterized protein LOC106124164 [Papilio xuthus]|uniref:Uncharacterized protein LOC106124164 n=1 Tax=Papilio xuthus TaxID=66420 RepID=A0AAJ6ZNF1_PAPXU|nr:PREDICTED: uncharacterized protein LOC106124164 [Papilio xuthus]
MNRLVIFCVIFLASFVNCEDAETKDVVEGRGKAKYALLMHFFYVVATKLFVLKIVYGIIFYVILTKAWHFVIWLIHYLKEKKHDHYVEYDHGEHYYDHHDHHHDYYDHQPYGKPSYGEPSYGKPSYGKSDTYGFKKSAIYDADGSYSVKKT